MKAAGIKIEVGVQVGCGSPESYWCQGHYPRDVFVAAVEAAEDEIGLRVTVPEHAEIHHAYQRCKPIDDEWIGYQRRRDAEPGFGPVTLVYSDECDEAQ